MARIRPGILFATLILTVCATVAASVFFFNARPVSKRVTVSIETPYTVTDPAFQRTLEALLRSAIVPGNAITLLRDGEAIFDSMLEAIDAAEASVTLEIYEFWGEEITGRFAESLSQKAREGIPVHVILDFIGSIEADSEVLEKMTEAGVELVRWREPSWYESSRFNHRTHRKLLVVDGRIGFTGGANIADPWIGDPEERYRDNHFRFEGPVVGHLQSSFMDNWLLSSGRLLLGDKYFPELGEAGSIRAQVVTSSPREGYKHIRTLFLLALASAETNIRIATAFFYPDPMMEQALIDASERGVTVEILAPGEDIKEEWVRYASRNRWGDMLKAGIRLYEYDRSPFHAKLIIIDDQWTSIGSANFDNRSFRINDETNVNVFDPDFARKMIDVFEADLENCVEYDLERWEGRPWHERLRGVAGNLIGPHL